MAAHLRTARIVLWVAVVVVAAVATGLYALGTRSPALASLGDGDYQLQTAAGEAFNRDSFNGHPSALFFGFTHCPDVCPTTLAEMTVWFETLGEEARDLKAYFVSVDPERDTPEVVGAYVAWTGHVTAVTGSRSEIDKAIKAWGVFAKRIATEDGSYTMDHTASVFLLDRQGNFTGTIAYREDGATAVAKLRKLIAADS